MATAIGTAMTMAMIEETTVPKARTAMPNFGGTSVGVPLEGGEEVGLVLADREGRRGR